MYPMFILQESALAHVELPTTVETVEAAIKKHKDFTTTMELNLHRIKAVIEAGESLISQSNIYSERIRERIDTLANRYINKNVLKSNKVNKGKESEAEDGFCIIVIFISPRRIKGSLKAECEHVAGRNNDGNKKKANILKNLALM